MDLMYVTFKRQCDYARYKVLMEIMHVTLLSLIYFQKFHFSSLPQRLAFIFFS